MTDLINRILPRVQKPARYTGGEYNEIIKDKSQVEIRVAFCFPDTYEIGMSNVGMRILYGIMNNMAQSDPRPTKIVSQRYPAKISSTDRKYTNRQPPLPTATEAPSMRTP